MKIKKILSLVCSVTLIATAVSTGAIITKADEQQSDAIKVDFSNYNQVDYKKDSSSKLNPDKANMNGYAQWGLSFAKIASDDNGNKYFKFSNEKSDGTYDAGIASDAMFLVDPNGSHGTTRLQNNTTYYLNVKYKFNKLDLSSAVDTETKRLLPYIAFKASFSDNADDSTKANPVNGFWTKYGYYANDGITDGIGMYSMDTANGADIWKTYETDNDNWTTGTLVFRTNGNVADKDMYFGFTVSTSNAGYKGMPINFDIDYIEITAATNENADTDADVYAYNKTGKNNTYVNFSAYSTKNNNASSGVTIVNSDTAPKGATGSKVAKIARQNGAGSPHTNFRATLTGNYRNQASTLQKEETYQLEMRYKLVDTSTEMGIYLSFDPDKKNHAYNAFINNNTVKLANGTESNKGMSLSNTCGDFWDEAAADDSGWVTAKLQFTAPDVCDGTVDTYFALAYTGTNSKLEMYIDYINIKLTAPVTIDNEVKLNAVPGESMAALAKDAKKENYETDSSKATAAETTYYYDGTYSNKVDLATAKYGANTVLYSKTETVVDTESQAAFCGFDEYKLRTYKDEFIKNENTAFFNAGYSSKSFSITSNDSYTGTKSLLYNYKNGDAEYDAYHKVAYIGNGYELIPGKTYALSFWYKPADGNEADNVDFIFTSGYSWASYSQSNNVKTYEATGLKEQTNEWKKAEFIWECRVLKPDQIPSKYNEISFCAPVLKIDHTDKNANARIAIYFDSFVISEVATYDGAAKLNTVDTDGKQAIRFKYSYDTVANAADNTVKIAGETYTVAERGILVKSANNSANLVRNTTANGVMKAVKKGNFDECWDYDAATGKYEFSMYIKGLDTEDSRELVSRAYVVLKDADNKETVFYSETSTASVEKITAKIESKTTAE